MFNWCLSLGREKQKILNEIVNQSSQLSIFNLYASLGGETQTGALDRSTTLLLACCGYDLYLRVYWLQLNELHFL